MKGSSLPGYYSRNLDGHRASYLDFVISRFGGTRVAAREAFGHKGPVLFLMIEENFALYLVAALWRALLGRRTVGLLFRPGPAVDGESLRLQLKRILLKSLRLVPRVNTLSIVPVPLVPRIGQIVNGWIHDFQLWDLSEGERARFGAMRRIARNHEQPGNISAEASAMIQTAREHAGGKPLLVALGMQNQAKGADRLAASLRDGGTLGWAVIVAGRFAPKSDSARAEIESHGGLIIDRFLSDEELLAMYASADAVWCLYDPAYDQASGILGRAVQLGVPPVVRRDSISEAFCLAEGISHGAAEGGRDLQTALSALALEGEKVPSGIALSVHFAQLNTTRLQQAMGLLPEGTTCQPG